LVSARFREGTRVAIESTPLYKDYRIFRFHASLSEFHVYAVCDFIGLRQIAIKNPSSQALNITVGFSVRPDGCRFKMILFLAEETTQNTKWEGLLAAI